MNNKVFTLIELLAVIIILGILMIIAIPSVTMYINDSRKNAYIDTAKEMIGSARNLVNEGKLKIVPVRLKISALISGAGMLCSIISAFTNLYYYIDETNTYHRGS